MAPAIVSKRGFSALVLLVSKGRNGYRVIIRIETGLSNLVSCFGLRIRALVRYFTSAFASIKYLSQRPHPRAKTWHKIWMTSLNPTTNQCCIVSESVETNLDEILNNIQILSLKQTHRSTSCVVRVYVHLLRLQCVPLLDNLIFWNLWWLFMFI